MKNIGNLFKKEIILPLFFLTGFSAVYGQMIKKDTTYLEGTYNPKKTELQKYNSETGIAKAQLPDTTKLEPLRDINYILINEEVFCNTTNDNIRVFENTKEIPNIADFVIYIKDVDRLNVDKRKALDGPIDEGHVEIYTIDKSNQSIIKIK